MASSEKTKDGLNLWNGNDSPKREDFVSDNKVTQSFFDKFTISTNITFYEGWAPEVSGRTYVAKANNIITAVLILLNSNSSEIASGTTIATIPEGYRPAQYVRMFGLISNGYNIAQATPFIVTTAGDISNSRATTGNTIILNFSYFTNG